MSKKRGDEHRGEWRLCNRNVCCRRARKEENRPTAYNVPTEFTCDIQYEKPQILRSHAFIETHFFSFSPLVFAIRSIFAYA